MKGKECPTRPLEGTKTSERKSEHNRGENEKARKKQITEERK